MYGPTDPRTGFAHDVTPDLPRFPPPSASSDEIAARQQAKAEARLRAGEVVDRDEAAVRRAREFAGRPRWVYLPGKACRGRPRPSAATRTSAGPMNPAAVSKVFSVSATSAQAPACTACGQSPMTAR
jgi:hypothetical protein